MSRSRIASTSFVLLVTLLGAAPLGAQSREEVAARYRELADAGDEAGLAALWANAPGLVLVTIDEDLEASLAAWEADPDAPDASAIDVLQARALLGARVASQATGNAIFKDYASAFVGWDDAQKRAFRQGQAAFGEAIGALRGGDALTALDAARRCTALAEPLGDWWGTAMGLSAQGQALLLLGRAEEAVVPAGRSVLLYDQLGLAGAEYGALGTLVDALVATASWPRAHAACEQALTLAHTLGDDEGAARFAERLATIRAAS